MRDTATTKKSESEGEDLGTCGRERGYKYHTKHHSSLVRILILNLRFTSEIQFVSNIIQ